MSSPPPASESNDASDSDSGSGIGILLRQTLMSVDECFVYKVPPLTVASSGYKANDWNLAQPLETCGFQVERRNDDLFLLFTLEHHTKLFCVSKIEGGSDSDIDRDRANRSIEPVSDSSRYFVCKISQNNSNNANNNNNNANNTNRSANLGFGFRDREVALDLLGNLQQFKQSIERERRAKELASKTKTIKVLKEGEKLHVRIPGKPGGGGGSSAGAGASGSKPPKPKASASATPRSPGGPFLLKKPPPGAGAAPTSTSTSTSTRTNKDYDRRFSMTDMECPLKEMVISSTKLRTPNDTSAGAIGEDEGEDEDEDQNSVAAVGTQSIVGDLDDLMTLGGDDADDDDNNDLDNDNLNETIDDDDDENSADAVGGGASADDDSFQFSELNLDDLDNNNNNDNETKQAATKESAPPSSNENGDDEDDDFGDFQAA